MVLRSSSELLAFFLLLSETMGLERMLSIRERVELDCPLNTSTPLWMGPDHECVVNVNNSMGNVYVDQSTLVIHSMGFSDRGIYTCFTLDSNNTSNDVVVSKAEFSVLLESEYRETMYYVSLIVGLCTAFGFLTIVLTAKLVFYLLNTYGCCLFCCCCKDRLPPKARKLKGALDSIEAYRQQQLEKLRESYNLQTEWISQNCVVQMERVRANYSSQVQNLRDIRKYGTSQLTSVRDQYHDQMAQIRDYSTAQLERVHENYIFQRQRLRKFSNQHYCRVRSATGQYTQRTLNRVMDNLPPLGLDLSTCRTTGHNDTHSVDEGPNVEIILETEAHFLRQQPNFEPKSFDNEKERKSSESETPPFMTPPQSPIDDSLRREDIGPTVGSKKRSSGSNVSYKSHKKSRSFSHYLPQRWLFGGSTENHDSPITPNEGCCDNDTRQVVVEVVIEHNRTPQKDVEEECEKDGLLQAFTHDNIKIDFIDDGYDDDKEKDEQV